MTCAKLWHDLIIIFHVRAMNNILQVLDNKLINPLSLFMKCIPCCVSFIISQGCDSLHNVRHVHFCCRLPWRPEWHWNQHAATMIDLCLFVHIKVTSQHHNDQLFIFLKKIVLSWMPMLTWCDASEGDKFSTNYKNIQFYNDETRNEFQKWIVLKPNLVSLTISAMTMVEHKS